MDRIVVFQKGHRKPCCVLEDFRGATRPFLERRGLMVPDVEFETNQGRFRVAIDPLYGRPGPLKIKAVRTEDNTVRNEIVSCSSGDRNILVREGKYLGEHYGYHPLTFVRVEDHNKHRGSEERGSPDGHKHL